MNLLATLLILFVSNTIDSTYSSFKEDTLSIPTISPVYYDTTDIEIINIPPAILYVPTITSFKIENSLEQIITRDDIESSNADNLIEILASLTNFTILRSEATSMNYSILAQGISETGILFLLNGRPLHNSINGTIDLNSIALENIECIEINRGLNTIYYASNALISTVNIITRKVKFKRPYALIEISEGYGDVKEEYYRVYFGKNLIHNIQFQFNVNATQSEWWVYPYTANYQGMSLHKFFNAYSLDANISVNRYTGRYGPYLSNQYNEHIDWDGNIHSFLHPNIFLNLNLFHSSIREKNTLGSHKIYRYGTQAEIKFNMMKNTKNRGDNEISLIGISEQRKIDGDIHNINKSYNALSVKAHFSFWQLLTLQTSTHLAQAQDCPNLLSWESILHFTPLNSLTLTLATHKGERFPNFNELYLPLTETSISDTLITTEHTSGNINLDNEIVNAYNIGLDYHTKRLKFSLSVFQNELNNRIIEAETIEDTISNLTPNNDNAIIRNQGLENRFYTRLWYFNIGGTYTYLHNKNINTEKPLAYRPEHTFNTYIEYDNQNFYDGELGITIILENDYLGNRYIDDTTTKSIGYRGLLHSKITIRVLSARIYYTWLNISAEEYEEIYNKRMPYDRYRFGIFWEFFD